MRAGVYSSFQQAWQERAPQAVHRVETDAPHACLEVEVAPGAGGLDVRVIAERRREVAREVWQASPGGVVLPADSLFASVEVTAGGLSADVGGGTWANPAPYRLVRARPFRGWIEVPEDGPYDPVRGAETVYRRVSDLRLHDQGGVVDIEADASGTPLAVELTRPVYARSLEILKLAVYATPAREVTTGSHAVAYAWTEPEAPRIGLNLRDVITGWTLDGASLANSDDADVPRSSLGGG